MRVIPALVGIALLVAVVLWLAGGVQAAALFHWANEQQRQVQTSMAAALRAIRGGDAAALMGLCALSAAYGFLHALGPGHGKVLLGSAALAGQVPMRRMLAIGVAASLAQAAMAVLVMALALGLLSMTSADASALAEGWLTRASRWAIAAIGALILWRGAKALWRAARAEGQAAPHRDHCHAPGEGQAHDHSVGCGCGHAHGPAPEQVAALRRPREVAALILSIALRPCTGALFLLAIAFRFGIAAQGILAVFAMGLGTAALNALAIGGGSLLQRLAAVSDGLARPDRRMAAAALQCTAGLIVILLTLGAGS